MYLLDTHVISELRKAKPHRAVQAWLESARESDLHISAVTMGEIQRGIEITKEQNPARAREIEEWANRLEATHTILPLDSRIMRVWAQLMHHTSDDLYEDAMIAATALVHDLTVVTRNVGDFAQLKAGVFNPFGASK